MTVEAYGEFAIFDNDGVHRMAAARRRAFDAGDLVAGEAAHPW